MEVYVLYGDEGTGIISVFSKEEEANNKAEELSKKSDGIFYFVETHTVV